MNSIYVVAENLVRYRAIFKKAGDDIKDLMFALTDKFATFRGPQSNGILFDFWSVAITGLTAATTAVISGGTGVTVGVLLGTAVAEMIGEAAKTTHHKLEGSEHLGEVVKQYLDTVNKIEREVASTTNQLWTKMRTEVEGLRAGRVYALPPATDPYAGIPHFIDYLRAKGL